MFNPEIGVGFILCEYWECLSFVGDMNALKVLWVQEDLLGATNNCTFGSMWSQVANVVSLLFCGWMCLILVVRMARSST